MQLETIVKLVNANKNLDVLSTWIENYLGIFFDSQIEIPELPNFINKKIDFTNLKNALISARQKVTDSQRKYENQIKDLHNEQYENYSKIERLCKEIQVLKENNMGLQNNLGKLNSTNERMEGDLSDHQVKINNFMSNTFNFINGLNKEILRIKPDFCSLDYLKDQMDTGIYEKQDEEKIYNAYSQFENNFRRLISEFKYN